MARMMVVSATAPIVVPHMTRGCKEGNKEKAGGMVIHESEGFVLAVEVLSDGSVDTDDDSADRG